MVIEALREYQHAVPFIPYEFRTVSGQRFQVPHPDFILISPRGAWVIVVDEEERPRHISGIMIESVGLLASRSRARKKR